MPELGQLGSQFQIKGINARERIVEGWASTFGNVDFGGDVVKAGAFSDWLSKNQPSQALIFVGHDYRKLPVATPITIKEEPTGLFCSVRVFPGPSGDDLLSVAEGMAAGGQKLGLSIGYAVDPGGFQWVKRDGENVRELTKLTLREISFTATPMNPAATVTGIKDQAGAEDKSAVGSFQWTMQHVQHALYERAQRGCYIQDIFPSRVIYRSYADDDVEQLYECSYSVNGTDVTLGEPTPVDIQYSPMPGKSKTTPDPQEPPTRRATVKDLPDSAFLFVEPGDRDVRAGVYDP